MNETAARRPPTHRRWGRRPLRAALLTLAVAVVPLQAAPAATAALTGVDLSLYQRVGRYDLPEPTRTSAPSGSLLAQEASSVTYNWDSDTLFVVGDGGTSVVQVSKTGQLIDSMTLPAGSSPQGTTFYDTEGIAYLGDGRFALVEERDRQVNRFRYVPNTTLTRADVETVKLGTTIGNVGIEGVTNDPISGGLIAVKEKDPRSIFQTGIDWAAHTATNGSPSANGSTDLFDPALLGLDDLSDVFALANLRTLTGPQRDHLLVISQESGRIVHVDRAGTVLDWLTLVADPGSPMSIPEQTHEGVTMDDDGILYEVSEAGGGNADRPQLWVYAPSTVPNQPPTAVRLTNATTTLAENSSTAARVKLAGVEIDDDGIGNNHLTLTGPDAGSFEVDGNGLYLKAGTPLRHATKSSYTVSVAVDDPSVGSSPDATSAPFTLTITPVSAAAAGTTLVVSEVSPWSSGDSPYGADWFELTNGGTTTVDLTGWKVDDDSNAFATAVALNGVTSLAPGESAVFVEGSAATATAFATHWFGTSPPAGLKVGSYSGSGIGLSTGGDQVNVFDAAGNRITGVRFGASTSGRTFDNAAGLGSVTSPPDLISTLSQAGLNGAFVARGEVGSPGRIASLVGGLLGADSPAFPAQPAGTIGIGQWVTVTNVGDASVAISRVRVVEDDDASAGDFLLTADRCTAVTLAPGESCRAQIRFAPGRENATSHARLVVSSDLAGEPTRITLTGTSVGLPAGPQGPGGPAGPQGPSGQDGAAGPQGPSGRDGAAGAQGPAGQTGRDGDPGLLGPQGAFGPLGPVGPQGPAGPKGDTGAAGKDGAFSFVASRSTVATKRGGTVAVSFRVTNSTSSWLGRSTITTAAPKALRLRGSKPVTVGALRAGTGRTVRVTLQIGRTAKLGRHVAKVRLTVGGRTVTRSVTLRVTR